MNNCLAAVVCTTKMLMNFAELIVVTSLFKMVVEQKICGTHGLATHLWKLLVMKLYGASEPESSEDEIAAVVPAVGAVFSMLAGVVGNDDAQDQFLSLEDSENSSRGEEDVHGIELGNLVATVVEENGFTVVENLRFTLVRLGSTSMGLEIRLMPVEKLGATVIYEMLVGVAKVVQFKKDQMLASALVEVVLEESKKKICCKVALLLFPSPNVAHSLPVAFCALAAEAAVTGLEMEGSRMYSGWLQASN